MRERLTHLYTLDAYQGIIERRQAIAAYTIATVGLSVALLRLIITVFAAPENFEQIGTLFGNVLPPIIFFAPLLLVRMGRLNIARWTLLTVGLMVTFVPPIGHGWSLYSVILTVALVIGAAALMVNERGVFIVTGISVVGGIVVSLSMSGVVENFNIMAETMSIATLTAFVGAIFYLLAQDRRRGIAHILEETAEHRLRMTELSAEVSQRIFQRLDLDTLLNDTVNLVRAGFTEIYHAQIFLVSEDLQQAVLQASTGSIGAELLARGHQLEVGSQSVIGQVTARGGAVLAKDTSQDPVHRRNELLPNTRTELALPLVSGERVIGALDVQSRQANAFSEDDITVLQTLANQIAVAIDNAQLFTRQQEAITENQRLFEQAESQLAEIQELNQRLTGQAWADYLQEQEISPALTVDFESGAMSPNAVWTPGLTAATQAGNTIHEAGENKQTLAVPLVIRGQIIGAMEFEIEDGETDSLPGKTSLAEDVAERLALAIESNRLYENAQRLAGRETVINVISTRLQASPTVESALATAAQSLQSALGAPRIAIRLGRPPDVDDGPTNGQEVSA